ncbi:AAA domain-containing protein [Flavobacterium sp. 270]|uniref:AAA family ATPase n=1 Tax=Flavobacterium sp. 270 TaxID=2512114 RepID=UPI0010652B11|nr:AAA family ATPase [Flavobacterium sp. 270]TDW51819.1 AAA domain-containing protein [Flavobacterium sp. 270]
MDKKVVFAVAGSGKTKLIIDELNEKNNSIVVTYTTSNFENLKDRIIRKFGYFPTNIKLYTYFSFLYTFCYKPFCHDIFKTNGINYNQQLSQYTKKGTRDHYIDKSNRLFFSRISKLLIDFNVIDDIVERINKYIDNIFIDEIQDFASNDFNFILSIAKTRAKLIYVGDFYQHTFDTSRDGSTKKNLYTDYLKYQTEFNLSGINVDTLTLIKSWRCNVTICQYISDNLKIPIESNRNDSSVIINLTDNSEIKSIFNNNKIVKLFYQKHYDYNCFSKNWGDCKGEDRYYDVCVVLNNNTYEKYISNDLQNLAPATKNKLYVAISRTKNNLYFVSEKLLKIVVKP